MDLFTISTPNCQAVPIVANLPHSGLFIPEDIVANLKPEYKEYLPNSDWHLDRLYDFLPNLGVTVLQANYSRYVVDLNRQVKKLCSSNFWSEVVALETAFGKSIYTNNPTEEEVKARIDRFYTPYHDYLLALLEDKVNQFGKVYLLDLHSFGGIIDDQVCLGNVNGNSCQEFLISSVEGCFKKFGYQVVRNKVFTGGYITRRYSQIPGVEVLQIEVRYHVYLDGDRIDELRVPDWDVASFYTAKSKLFEVFGEVVALAKALRR